MHALRSTGAAGWSLHDRIGWQLRIGVGGGIVCSPSECRSAQALARWAVPREGGAACAWVVGVSFWW